VYVGVGFLGFFFGFFYLFLSSSREVLRLPSLQTWLYTLLFAYAENIGNSLPCCCTKDQPGEVGAAISQVTLKLPQGNEHPSAWAVASHGEVPDQVRPGTGVQTSYALGRQNRKVHHNADQNQQLCPPEGFWAKASPHCCSEELGSALRSTLGIAGGLEC